VLRRDEERKDADAKKYIDVAETAPPVVPGSQWYWSFSVDMPTIFEPEVTQ
jgi:hypothetical protein